MKFFRSFLVLLCSLLVVVIAVTLLFGYGDKSVEDLKEKYAPSPSAFVEVDGMNVHYRDEGNPIDSLPIVLIHGTGSSLHTFDGWASDLKNQQRVVRMDLPAFGLTGPFPNHNYSMDNYVAFLENFLKALGIKQCVLVGNSLGGQLAWEFTLKNSNMVQKLLLIDAAGYPIHSKSSPIAFTLARTPFLNKIMTFITPRFLVKSSIENVYADKGKVSEALIDRYFDLTLRTGNRQGLVDRMLTVYDTTRIAQIGKIQQPTLVLWGEQDLLITLESAYRFHEDLPNDTLLILKNAGHVPMEESPNESLKVIMFFLKK